MLVYFLFILFIILLIIDQINTYNVREKGNIYYPNLKESLKQFYLNTNNTKILIQLHNGSKDSVQYDDLADYITNKKSNLYNYKIHQDYIETQNKYGVDNFNIYNTNIDFIYLSTQRKRYKFTVSKLNFIRWCIQNKIIEGINNEIMNI